MKTDNYLLHRYSQFTLLAMFSLILIGSLVTTNGAGMAFSDWPLSSGSLSPDGWWAHFPERLEHLHRLFAGTTGVLIGILCAWVWSNRWAIPVAVVVSIALTMAATIEKLPVEIVAHISIWSATIVITTMLLFQNRSDADRRPAGVRWLAFSAFIGVVIQAVLGGLRVTLDAGGHSGAALAVRVIHGCVAQIEFCLLSGLVAMLSTPWPGNSVVEGLSRIRRLAWLTFSFAFLQLALGAAIRHMGIALVIPTFPLASSHGFMPSAHNAYIDLNFTHTRFMALIIAVHVVLLWLRIVRTPSAGTGLIYSAWLLLGLLVAQIVFGITIIWTLRNPVPTTLHVVNGAALLATSFVIALRASCLQAASPAEQESAAIQQTQPELI